MQERDPSAAPVQRLRLETAGPGRTKGQAQTCEPGLFMALRAMARCERPTDRRPVTGPVMPTFAPTFVAATWAKHLRFSLPPSLKPRRPGGEEEGDKSPGGQSNEGGCLAKGPVFAFFLPSEIFQSEGGKKPRSGEPVVIPDGEAAGMSTGQPVRAFGAGKTFPPPS